MEGVRTETPATAEASQLHFREQPEEQGQPHDDTTVSFQGGSLKVSGDEDAGADPYNRTGRFRRNVR